MQTTKKSKQLEKIYTKFDMLVAQTVDMGASKSRLDTVERNLLKGLLKLGFELLKLVIFNRQAKIEAQGKPQILGELKNNGLSVRCYGSIFGEMDITRRKFYITSKGTYYPLDADLSLPPEKLSYVLQDWVSRASTELDYRQSVELLNEVLDLNLNGVQSKFHTNELGEQVDDFYDEQTVIPVAEGDYLCLEWDGKGVPIIKEPAAESKTSVAARLKKGEKRGVKKMATVSVVSDFSPKIRTKKSIIRGLFKTPLTPLEEEKKKTTLEVVDSSNNNWHQHIHRRAFLGKQEVSIGYGANLAKKRMQGKGIPIVVLVDGGSGLEEAIRAAFKAQNMEHQLAYMILDIVHVSEYVWKAGNAILGEKSELRTPWVRAVLSDILDGKIGKVIDDLKNNLEQTELSESGKQLLKKTITYFTNHQHKMDYKTYLEKGMPVSTALVESSCGHLVKDRMERSGMRWSMEGAQNMMDVRAVKKNDNWADFMDFVIQRNQQKQLKKAA